MPTPPRHLRILPCNESFADMSPLEGGARHCDRCTQRVENASALTEAQLERLLERSGSERVCLRSELVDGRPRLATGVAAGLVAIALAGCATPGMGARVAEPTPAQRAAEQAFWTELAPGEGGVIAGVVRDQGTGEPIENAIVVLQSTTLPEQLERMTNARGIYSFGDLPPGQYTVQVLAGLANVSKVTDLPEGARFRSNFSIDPQMGQALTGVLIPEPPIPMDASSTYHSSMIWID